MASGIRFQIFVSSTYTDLYPVRRKVTEHILSMNHIPAGMEMFSASGQQQWKTIQKSIDNSDYYVLIVGERYGSISEAEGISYTEKEFNYARSRGIPTLCFLSGEKYTTTREKREADPLKIELLEKFKRKVLSDQLCDFWEDENELVRKISAALYKIFVEEPGIGWIRGDVTDPEALSKLIKVMEDNAKLTAKINELENNVTVDVPKLLVRMNQHDFLKGSLDIQLPKPEGFEFGHSPISIEDIPVKLRSLISEGELKLYNSLLPSKDEVDKYFLRSSLYTVGCSSPINFSIYNSGHVKANNVLIRMYIPDGLRVLKHSEVSILPEPSINMPLHPINLAEKREKSSEPDSLKIVVRKVSQGLAKKVRSQTPSSGQKTLTIRKGKSIFGSKDFIRQSTLHSLSSDIYLIPERLGEFKIRVTIICDEYREWSDDIIIINFIE